SAQLANAALQAGVEVKAARGTVSCRGQYDGQQLDGLAGEVFLEQATVLGQPVRNFRSRLEVEQDTPDVLRCRDVSAEMFGGVVGAQGLLEFGPHFRYDLELTALGVKLEEFGKHNFGKASDVQGLAMAKVYLSGTGTEVGDLKGNGQFEVPS